MIECKNVSFNYEGQNELLKGVSFSIERGSIAYLLGLIGCGKTTLLNCIGGNIKNYNGLIKTDENCHHFNQLPIICDKLTGIEYIEMLMTLRNKVDNSDVNDLISTLGISKLLNRPIKDAAPYTKSLLILLSSICSDSNTIILDDPFKQIDRKSQIKLTSIIKKLKEQGKTVLIATNVIYSGFDTADELLILHHGKIRQFKNNFESMTHYENKILPIMMK